MTFGPKKKSGLKATDVKHERRSAASDRCDWMEWLNLPTKSLHGSSCDLNERDLF